MEITYDEMKRFMESYFEAYNQYSQTKETIHKMDDYWGEDFKSAAYFKRSTGPSPIVNTSGSSFRDMIASVHEVMEEYLLPQDIIIDERRKKCSVFLHIKKVVIKTGAEHEFTGIANYKIGFDENNKLKLKSLDICVDDPEGLTGLWHY